MSKKKNDTKKIDQKKMCKEKRSKNMEKKSNTSGKKKTNIVTISSSIINDKDFMDRYLNKVKYHKSYVSSLIEIDIHAASKNVITEVSIVPDDEVSRYILSILNDVPVDYNRYPAVFDIMKKMVTDHMMDDHFNSQYLNAVNAPVGFDLYSDDNFEYQSNIEKEILDNDDDIVTALSRYKKFIDEFKILEKPFVDYANRAFSLNIDFINKRKQFKRLCELCADNAVTLLTDTLPFFKKYTDGIEVIRNFYKGNVNAFYVYRMLKPLIASDGYECNLILALTYTFIRYLNKNVFDGDCMFVWYVYTLQSESNTDDMFEFIYKHRFDYKTTDRYEAMYYYDYQFRNLIKDDPEFQSYLYHIDDGNIFSIFDSNKLISDPYFISIISGDLLDVIYKTGIIGKLEDPDDISMIEQFLRSDVDYFELSNQIRSDNRTNGVNYIHELLTLIKDFILNNLFEGKRYIFMKEVKDILKGCLVNDSMDLDKAMSLLEKEPPVAEAINIYDMSEETEQTSSADDEHDVQSTIDNTDSKIAMYLKDIILNDDNFMDTFTSRISDELSKYQLPDENPDEAIRRFKDHSQFYIENILKSHAADIVKDVKEYCDPNVGFVPDMMLYSFISGYMRNIFADEISEQIINSVELWFLTESFDNSRDDQIIWYFIRNILK